MGGQPGLVPVAVHPRSGSPDGFSHLDGTTVQSYAAGPSHERSSMSEPQLSVRSARARALAHRLARRERRTIADIVERALEAYEVAQTGREPAAGFYSRLSRDYGTDIDLDTVVHEHRKANTGPNL